MHGLINRSIQCFLRDTHGPDVWAQVAEMARVPPSGIEAMLVYDDSLTLGLLEAAGVRLSRPREALLEDLGTYLVSHPNAESLRRLLRFGGVGFVDFLHSLDQLPGRARLAVPELELPVLELEELGANRFVLTCRFRVAGFGHVLAGVLRAMADDYGALVLLDHAAGGEGGEVIGIHLLDTRFAEGRHFRLSAALR